VVELPVAGVPLREEPPLALAPLPGAARPLRVLLVEDHEPTLRAVRRLLHERRHEVVAVASIAAATEAAARQPFDLLLSDLGLPDGSGLELMHRLKDTYAGRAIALTGYGMGDDLRATTDAGFAEHLTKPVDARTLLEAIDRLTGQDG
jgi:CheY-like chemotaxis protein